MPIAHLSKLKEIIIDEIDDGFSNAKNNKICSIDYIIKVIL
jgi:hypothetical protein